jgi:hypothetical protein
MMMDTYRRIRVGRGLTWAGILLGAAAAGTVGILNLTIGDGSVYSALAFAAMLAIPSIFAFISLDRRPSLLTAATMTAVVAGVFLIMAGIGFIYFLVATLWYFANGRRPRPAPAPSWATWGRPLLAAAALVPLLVLVAHLDPECTVTSADGTVTSAPADGYPTGWSFAFGTSGSGHSGDGTTTSCTSNTIRPWEALSSLAMTSGLAWVGTRWPTTAELEPDAEIVRSSAFD